MKQRDPSLELAQSVLRLDAEAGKLRWAKDIMRSNGSPSSFKAGNVAASKGYVTVAGVVYPALRVAWLLLHGAPAVGTVSPLDGDRSNLKPENMLDCGTQYAPPDAPLLSLEDALTAEEARAIFAYDTRSGVLSWRRDRRTTRGYINGRAGDPVGGPDKKGYLIVLFQPPRSPKARHYFVHRIIWLMVTGQWPANEVDHLNGIKSDNRWLNLRGATDEENNENRRRSNRNNKTGLLGVHFDKVAGKFIARIGHKRKLHILGRFDTAEEAHQAYLTAKRKLHKANTL